MFIIHCHHFVIHSVQNIFCMIGNSYNFLWLVQRITIAELINNEWFKKGYQPPRFETVDVNLDDVNSIFDESGVSLRIIQFILRLAMQCMGMVNKIASINAGPSTTCC